MKNIALLSPSKNQFSETFIQKHKRFIAGNVFYFFNGVIPGMIEFSENNRKGLSLVSDIVKIQYFVSKLVLKKKENLREYALKKAFLKHKIDCVYAEYGTTANACLRVCQLLNLPLIVNFHGYDISVNSLLKENKNYKDLLEYAKSVVVVSQQMKRRVIELGCDESKIYYTPCAPDDSFFELKPTFSKNQFVAVGRFVDKKAPYYTILAFKKALSINPNIKLILIGEGILKNTLINLVKYLEIEDSVVFKGVLVKDEISLILMESLALVQHSITAENGDMEGTPVAIMEASASGIPIISTNHCGIMDVVINNETGILVDEHDVDGMSSAMIELANNVNLARQMGIKGRDLIKSNYSMSSHIKTINSAINC